MVSVPCDDPPFESTDEPEEPSQRVLPTISEVEEGEEGTEIEPRKPRSQRRKKRWLRNLFQKNDFLSDYVAAVIIASDPHADIIDKEAMQQIHDKNYSLKYQGGDKAIVLLGVEFDQKSRNLGDFLQTPGL